MYFTHAETDIAKVDEITKRSSCRTAIDAFEARHKDRMALREKELLLKEKELEIQRQKLEFEEEARKK